MKQLLTIFIVLISFCATGQVRTGPSGNVQPTGPYGAVHDTDLLGSHRTVADTFRRNAIIDSLRRPGMTVYTIADSITWILRGCIQNSCWVAIFKGANPANIDSTIASTQRDYSNPLSGMPVTSRLIMPQSGLYSASQPIQTYRSRHQVDKPTQWVRFVYVNQTFNNTATNLFNISVSVQAVPTSSTAITGITIQPVTFNGGSPSIAIPAGGFVISDPIYAPLNPVSGAYYLVRTACYSEANNNNWPIGLRLASNTNEGIASGDQTLTNVSFSTVAQGYAPQLITTAIDGKRTSFFVAGTSIVDGSNDNVNNRGHYGMLTEDYPISLNRAAVGGEMLSTVINSGYLPARWFYSQHASHVISSYGTNDLGGGVNSSTLRQLFVTYWSYFALQGKKVYATTILPRATSSDGWTTASNQTPWTLDTARIVVNDWLRAGAPCTVSGYTVTPVAIGTPGAVRCPYLTGIIDEASFIEVDATNALTINGGRWRVGGVINSGPVTSATTTTLTNTGINFNNLTPPTPGALVRITSGTGSGQINWIVGNATSNTLSLLNSWTTTPDATSTYEIIDTYTRDAVHPSTNCFRTLEAGVWNVIKNF